ncbi:uncharacterized protein LOC126906773 isoform X2 [Daktulosphaira vitifoliae]|uniref:uncharacterized protein LOC126906773 isoform X2 n=1 Tax=Daktulosphaira vitifoliae TaxID=58002 RepID=UPI0021A9F6D9|nr:uncharacterized protein LOC126906773 isoform X2 [Daktulosphaira vitifoliae]
MILWEIFIILHGFHFGWCSSAGQAPDDITVIFLSPNTVQVSWKISLRGIEKYDVMYKPTNARVVAEIAVNSDSVTLGNLMPNTQYQVIVTAFKAGRRYRSRPVIFKTLEKGVSWPDSQQSSMNSSDVSISSPDIVGGSAHTITPEDATSAPYIQVRGIEITIVVLVLMVWVGAIIMFFNRWGKIRMLIPYQPDYKDTQLKVPGTGACNTTTSCQNQTGTGFCCSQRHLMRCVLTDQLDWRVQKLLRSRSRINSAIYISPIYQDAHIRNGISVRPIRKARSADYLPQYDYSGWANGPQLSLPLSRVGNNFTVGVNTINGSGQQKHIKRFQLPTVSISIASDSDKALNELLI